MNDSPMKKYGFEYQFEGAEFTFCVVANSQAVAEQMILAMAGARFAGEMTQVPEFEPPNV